MRCIHDIVIGGPKQCCGASSCTPEHNPGCKYATKADQKRFEDQFRPYLSEIEKAMKKKKKTSKK